eukprot:SAG22_NODE_116_length_19306_cov_247.696517_24_plen_107_part_00
MITAFGEEATSFRHRLSVALSVGRTAGLEVEQGGQHLTGQQLLDRGAGVGPLTAVGLGRPGAGDHELELRRRAGRELEAGGVVALGLRVVGHVAEEQPEADCNGPM